MSRRPGREETGRSLRSLLTSGSTGQVLTRDTSALGYDWATPAAGGGGGTGFEGARVRQNAVQSLTHNTLIALTFDVEDHDIGDYWDSGSDTRLTVTEAGYYRVHGACSYGGRTDYDRVALGIRLNGTTYYTFNELMIDDVISNDRQLETHTYLKMDATDYVELMARQVNGASANQNTVIGGGNVGPRFSIERLDAGQLIAGWSPILDYKPTTDTPDDEFDSTTLDGKWTAVSGSAGTVNFFETSNVEEYDLATRPGYLLTQAGRGGTQNVQLRQDFTLADGDSIIAAVSPAVGVDGTPGFSADQDTVLICVNNNDTSYSSGTYLWVGINTSASGNINAIAWDGTTSRGGLVGHGPGRVYLRISRSGTTYYPSVSSNGGMTWTHLGAGYALGSAMDNIWIVQRNDASHTGVVAISAWDWIRQGTNNLDPWSHSGLVTVEQVYKWTDYTPTWTSTGTAPSIGNGTLTGRWYRLGAGTDAILFVQIRLNWGSTTSGGTGDWRFSVPEAVSTPIALSGTITDSGTDNKVASTKLITATTFEVIPEGANVASATSPMTWATNDALFLDGTLRVQ